MDNKEKPEDERKIVLGVDDEEAILDLLKFNIEKEVTQNESQQVKNT